MPFDKALYDGSDPLYAPLTGWSRQYLYWRPAPRYKQIAHGMKSTRLTGQKGDGQDAKRAAEARQLTRDLLKLCGEGSDVKMGTWGWVIHQYRTDPYSPMAEVKQNTRDGYEFTISRWEKAIGHMPVRDLTFKEIKRTEAAMKSKGRSSSYIHRMFTMLRGLSNYARAALESEDAERVSSILSTMRFSQAAPRTTFVTRDQITAIVAEADRLGMEDFACGLMLQWVFALRAVDVRGQWFEIDGEANGGITRETQYTKDGQKRRKVTRWQDGLTWDMIAPDFSTLTKTISKTAKSMPEPICLDLTETPGVQDRLRKLAMRGRVGPVILADKHPYTISGWGHAFARIRDDLKLPKEITARDIRAGALTEMKSLGIDATAARDAAGHANVTTTSRYMRDRSEGANRVVKLRGGG